jgi:hypothetical protein
VLPWQARWQVIFLRTSAGSVCDFLIVTLQPDPGRGHCPGISCKFWLWCLSGTIRFFPLGGSGLIELSLHGLPFVLPVTARFASQPDNRTEVSEKNLADPSAG